MISALLTYLCLIRTDVPGCNWSGVLECRPCSCSFIFVLIIDSKMTLIYSMIYVYFRLYYTSFGAIA
jgi:hypothetical protein